MPNARRPCRSERQGLSVFPLARITLAEGTARLSARLRAAWLLLLSLLSIAGAAVAASCRVEGLLGETEWPAGFAPAGVAVGGLSGLAWEEEGRRVLAISDDRGEIAPPRWHDLEVSVPGGATQSSLQVTLGTTVALRGTDGRTLPRNAADGEAIALAGDVVYVASEGFRLTGVPPFVHAFARDGALLFELPLPARYLPADEPPRGARHNTAFEGLAVSTDGRLLYAALEAALLQDGPAPDVGVPSPARILVFDLTRREPAREVLYWTDPLPQRPLLPGGTRLGGLVEIAALGAERLLALERAFVLGAGFSIRLYEVDLAAAEDLRGRADVEALRDAGGVRAVAKELLLDLAALGVRPRNVEGMALGSPDRDGRRLLLLASDNNFGTGEPAAQFYLLGLRCEAPLPTGS